MQRKGLGRFLGRGYKNLVHKDPYIHGLSAKGVKTVSIPRYMGRWHRQGSIPTWFEKGCSNVMADYEYKDNKVVVKNSCDRDGKRDVAYGEASPVSTDNKNLKVGFRPFTFFKGDYKIEYVDKDYKYAVVGHPDKTYLWILSRQKKIPKAKYNELLKIAKDKGYNVSEVKLGATGKVSTHILSPAQYDNLFAKDYKPYEISYATTRIDGLGNVNIYVKDSGDQSRNNALLRHEQEELRLFKGLVRDGINQNIADELAHNLNPVKVSGVDDHYPLNPDN